MGGDSSDSFLLAVEAHLNSLLCPMNQTHCAIQTG